MGDSFCYQHQPDAYVVNGVAIPNTHLDYSLHKVYETEELV